MNYAYALPSADGVFAKITESFLKTKDLETLCAQEDSFKGKVSACSGGGYHVLIEKLPCLQKFGALNLSMMI